MTSFFCGGASSNLILMPGTVSVESSSPNIPIFSREAWAAGDTWRHLTPGHQVEFAAFGMARRLVEFGLEFLHKYRRHAWHAFQQNKIYCNHLQQVWRLKLRNFHNGHQRIASLHSDLEAASKLKHLGTLTIVALGAGVVFMRAHISGTSSRLSSYAANWPLGILVKPPRSWHGHDMTWHDIVMIIRTIIRTIRLSRRTQWAHWPNEFLSQSWDKASTFRLHLAHGVAIHASLNRNIIGSQDPIGDRRCHRCHRPLILERLLWTVQIRAVCLPCCLLCNLRPHQRPEMLHRLCRWMLRSTQHSMCRDLRNATRHDLPGLCLE